MQNGIATPTPEPAQIADSSDELNAIEQKVGGSKRKGTKTVKAGKVPPAAKPRRGKGQLQGLPELPLDVLFEVRSKTFQFQSRTDYNCRYFLYYIHSIS